MLLKRFSSFSAVIAICILHITTGCTYTMALKFKPMDSTTYRITMGYEKSIEWMGSASDKPAAFQDGRTGNNLQITFTQDILSVNSQGNTVARITFKDLKYFREVRNVVDLDFDSSRAADTNNPLYGLIGQSYFIELTPQGQVSKVIDTSDAQSAVQGSSPDNLTALNLLSENLIKERHTISALPEADRDKVKVGDKWSNIKEFSFDIMGEKYYERVYTFEKVNQPAFAAFTKMLRNDNSDHKIAVVGMEAYPSTEQAKQHHLEEQTSPVSSLFDNIQSYTGELRLDLTVGQVQRYYEKLLSEWVIAEPTQSAGEQPDALKMGATRSYSIQRID